MAEPTVFTGQETTYTGAFVVVRQLENYLQLLDPDDYPLLQSVGLGSYPYPIENPKFEWQMDFLNPLNDALAAAIVATDATTTTAAHGEYFAKNDLVLVDSEIIQVTAVSGDTLTISRGFGGTTAATHSNGAPLYRLGPALAEGSAPGWAQQVDTVQPYNYTQIWDAVVEVSGTEKATRNYGPEDIMAYRIDKRMRELYMLMERSYLLGVRYQPSTNTGRSSGGLDYFIHDKNNLSGAALAYDDIADAMEDVFSRVGMTNVPDQLWVNANLKRQISAWNDSYMRMGRAETVTGQVVDSLLTDFGTLTIRLDHLIKSTEAWLLNMQFCQAGPMSGRAFQSLDASTPGTDAAKERILGEYGFVVRGEDGTNDGPQVKIYGAATL